MIFSWLAELHLLYKLDIEYPLTLISLPLKSSMSIKSANL